VPVVNPKPVSSVGKTVVSTSVSTAEASFSPASLTISASDSYVSPGAYVSFATNAMVHYKAGTLIGKNTQVLFQPLETIWRFGDGGSAIGAAAGHNFSREGIFDVEATVSYAVSYQIAGASIWVESGSIEVSDSLSIVVTASPVNYVPTTIESGKIVRLVGKNCIQNPGTFGCDG
jgi:hypothetical protein